MSEPSSNKSIISSFWLSLILHLLLFFLIITSFVFQPRAVPPEKAPNNYVPSYVYTGGIQPHMTAAKQSPSTPVNKEHNQATKKQKANPSFPQTAVRGDTYTSSKKPVVKQSILAASLNMLQQDQVQAVESQQAAEPIYLIGDMSQAADPLIKLIGRALSANFRYPEMAGRLGIRGRAIVAMTIHPEGYFNDVQLIQSSGSPDLDAAALYAVNQAPTVVGADRYIQQPKHFIIGFIFD